MQTRLTCGAAITQKQIQLIQLFLKEHILTIDYTNVGLK